MEPVENKSPKFNQQFLALLLICIGVSGIVGFFAGRAGSQPSQVSILTGDQVFRASTEEESLVVTAVERAQPAVVSVVVSRDVPVIERCFINPFGDNPLFRQFFGDIQVPSECETGTERRQVGGGSGFIVTSDGTVVTNRHVVADERADYTVILNDGSQFDAEVVARDPINDIAILNIDKLGLPTLSLADSDSIRIGQSAIAIGNALGEFQNSVSVGVISGLSRSIVASSGGTTEQLRNIIQTDAAINPGNSGGPLLNLRGEVIGINTAVAQGAENIGFAIPVNLVRYALESVERSGRVVYPFLGVRYVDLNPTIAEENNLPVSEGAWLSSEGEDPVLDGSPADRAGLEEGDIIVAVNGERIGGTVSLGDLLTRHSVGETITLSVRRGDSTLELQATLVEREF
jgi:serine protease Do